jgi:HEAT repeat protein
VRLLEEERARVLGALVDRARVASAPAAAGEEPGDGHELAGFISEMRAEIDRLTRWKAAAVEAGVELHDGGPHTLREASARAADPLPAVAARLAEGGRARLGDREAASIAPRFATRAERALYLASLDELASADPGTRRRAARCLRSLGSRAAAPVLAAALGREADADAKAAILEALGGLGETSAADLAARELGDARPGVRAAALDALAALQGEQALPRLCGALGDQSPRVRRRAAVLLGFRGGDAADEALASALADRDAGVARAAAVALAGRPSRRAQGTLARALDHREAAVRRAAARAVERWSGERVDENAAGAERRRAALRIGERLHAMDGAELRQAVSRIATATLPLPSRAAAPAATAVVDPDPALEAAVTGEVRTALRGRTCAEIAAALGAGSPAVEGTLRALAARGLLVARGPRWFLA